MKRAEAERLIKNAHTPGYRVSFERREHGILASDFFPDRDEVPIIDLEDAWGLARAFATVNPRLYVNIYVIRARDYTPVDGYAERMLNKNW